MSATNFSEMLEVERTRLAPTADITELPQLRERRDAAHEKYQQATEKRAERGNYRYDEELQALNDSAVALNREFSGRESSSAHAAARIAEIDRLLHACSAAQGARKEWRESTQVLAGIQNEIASLSHVESAMKEEIATLERRQADARAAQGAAGLQARLQGKNAPTAKGPADFDRDLAERRETLATAQTKRNELERRITPLEDGCKLLKRRYLQFRGDQAELEFRALLPEVRRYAAMLEHCGCYPKDFPDLRQLVDPSARDAAAEELAAELEVSE